MQNDRENPPVINDGGSAFPVNTGASLEPGAYCPDPGMTLRDWFAGQALMVVTPSQTVGAGPANWSLHHHLQAAEWAYARADAMLLARTERTA